MAMSIEVERIQILEELRTMKRLRRGQISEQTLKKKGADGRIHEYGPYFVWQASLSGKKRSQRIPLEKVDQAREDLETYKRFQQLCERLASLMEQTACDLDTKKKSTKRKAP